MSLYFIALLTFSPLVLSRAYNGLNKGTIFSDEGRIVNGTEVKPYSIPFQVSVQNIQGFHFCGGSLMNEDTVITAGHCCYRQLAENLRIVVGEHDLLKESGDEQMSEVSSIKMRDDYSPFKTLNDICLLKLVKNIELNEKVSTVKLPESEEEFEGEVVVSGWGTTYFHGPTSPVLLSTTLEITSRKQCSVAYPGKIDESMICAYTEGKDSCQGDSGGPLVQDGTLVGIVSWGRGCAEVGYPGVYAKVSKFINWIEVNA
uniref:Trypsin-1 n=1 Tax=Caligus rogercresseyi TaxID=217165 RepID=C1BMZ6_CALRO|nr:Trypsin-1 precursor [Caligus rogercresseyi]